MPIPPISPVSLWSIRISIFLIFLASGLLIESDSNAVYAPTSPLFAQTWLTLLRSAPFISSWNTSAITNFTVVIVLITPITSDEFMNPRNCLETIFLCFVEFVGKG